MTDTDVTVSLMEAVVAEAAFDATGSTVRVKISVLTEAVEEIAFLRGQVQALTAGVKAMESYFGPLPEVGASAFKNIKGGMN